jgi:hypothetical protein
MGFDDRAAERTIERRDVELRVWRPDAILLNNTFPDVIA